MAASSAISIARMPSDPAPPRMAKILLEVLDRGRAASSARASCSSSTPTVCAKWRLTSAIRSPAASAPCQVNGSTSIASPRVAATRRARTRGSSSVDRRRRWDLVHPRLADDDRARRTHLGDVRLPPADDDGDDADAGAAWDAQPPALVVEAPVGAGQRLGQRDEDARREVVVVVALDRVERLAAAAGERRAPARSAARGGRGCPSCAPGHRLPARGSATTSNASGGRSSADGSPILVAKRLLMALARVSCVVPAGNRDYRDALPGLLDPPKRPVAATRWSPPAGRACGGSPPTPVPRRAGSAPGPGSGRRPRRAPSRRSTRAMRLLSGPRSRRASAITSLHASRTWASASCSAARRVPCRPRGRAGPPRRPPPPVAHVPLPPLEPVVADAPDGRRHALPPAASSVPGSAVVTITWPRPASRSLSRRRAVGVELAEDVVQQDDGPRAVGAEQVGLGQLQRQDDRALLAAAGVGRDVATAELRAKVVSLRPDQAHAVPRLASGGPRRCGAGRQPPARPCPGSGPTRSARSGHASLSAVEIGERHRWRRARSAAATASCRGPMRSPSSRTTSQPRRA